MAKIVVVGSFVVGLTIRVLRMPVIGEGLIGDDLLSKMAFDTFQKEGISLDHIHRIEGVNTAVGVVHLIPSGDNWIVGHLGANLEMQTEHVDAAEDLIAGSDLLLSQFEVPFPVVQRAMALARKHGVQTVWNPAPAQTGSTEILQHVDVLTPNETEVRILLDRPPDDSTPTLELAQKLLGEGVSCLVVTLGEKGSLVVTPEEATTVPAVPNIKAVDVTGAGDSFNAALAVSLAEGKPLSDAVQLANYAGAFAVQHLGVIDGLPTRDELASFQKETVRHDQ